MIRRLRAIACCNRSRLPLFAILVALWAANGSPGVSVIDQPETSTLTVSIR